MILAAKLQGAWKKNQATTPTFASDPDGLKLGKD